MSCFRFASFPVDLSTSSAHALDFCWSKQWLKQKKVWGRLKWELKSSLFVDLFIGKQYSALFFIDTALQENCCCLHIFCLPAAQAQLRSRVFFSLKCSVIWKESIHGTAYLPEQRKNRPLNIWLRSAVHSIQQIRYRWKKKCKFCVRNSTKS